MFLEAGDNKKFEELVIAYRIGRLLNSRVNYRGSFLKKCPDMCTFWK